MNYIVTVAVKARRELAEASNWYDGKQLHLGEQFEEAIFKKIYLIQANPLQYPMKDGLREAVSDDFPFIIIYKVVEKGNKIIIVSVFHMSRHPKNKR